MKINILTKADVRRIVKEDAEKTRKFLWREITPMIMKLRKKIHDLEKVNEVLYSKVETKEKNR